MDSEDGQPAPKAPEMFSYMNRSPEALEVLKECLQKRTTPAGLDYEELGGLLHIEHEYIAHHIRRRDSGLEHLIASMQPEKYSKNHSRRPRDSKPEQRIPEALESTRRHLQKYSMPAGLDYEELGGLSDPRQ